MVTTFILEHRTPRTVQFIPAGSVQVLPKGRFSYTKLRRSEASLTHMQVMAALSKCMRGKGVCRDLLERSFNEAKRDYPGLMEGATFRARRADGLPATVVIKDEMS